MVVLPIFKESRTLTEFQIPLQEFENLLLASRNTNKDGRVSKMFTYFSEVLIKVGTFIRIFNKFRIVSAILE